MSRDSLDDFLAAAARAARPDRHHPGAALEARLYLATAVRIIRAVQRECEAADGLYGSDAGLTSSERIRAAMTNARRRRK